MADLIPPHTHRSPNPEDQDLDLDSLLNLEDSFYTEGYSLGVADGSREGRNEGRIFGLEKGFEKFSEIGRLNGRAAVWQARLPSTTDDAEARRDGEGGVGKLKGGDRLRKHVERLVELTEAESLETRNMEDAVNEADERLAGARAKFTLISRIVGEDDVVPFAAARPRSSAGGKDGEREGEGLEVEIGRNGKAKKLGEMEDFVGLPAVVRKRDGGTG